MKGILFLIVLLVAPFLLQSQVTSVTIGTTQSIYDSTFVIQTSQTDSFHAGNHPGAGPYMNAEIYLCGGSNLIYNYQPGTSSEPRFYLESGSTLTFTQWNFAQIYAKSGSTIDLNNVTGYFGIRRESGVTLLNLSSPSAIMFDSVFTTLNYNFSSWPGGNSPCLSPTTLNNAKESDLIQITNPSGELLHVFCKSTVSNINLELFDLAGRKVYSAFLVQGNQTLSLHSIPKGFYLYRVSSQQGMVKQDKLLVQ